MNKAILVGNITKDLELKKTPNNKSVLEFSVAINENKDIVDYVNVQAWEKTAETISKYFAKGNKILIEGKIKTNSYDGQNGKVYRTFVLADRFEFVGVNNKDVAPANDEVHIAVENNTFEIDKDLLPFY